jgi:hypothetical protein
VNERDKVKNNNRPTSFFTETTPGNLVCKRIIFANWSPSQTTMGDETLRKHIQKFISKSIKYVIRRNKRWNFKTKSIAYAVPDSLNAEKILAEEMIYETKRRIESTKSSLKISFILLPEQRTLYEQFLAVIQKMQSSDDGYAIFSCPLSSKILYSEIFPFYVTDQRVLTNNNRVFMK